MNEEFDRQMQLIFEFFERLHRKAPGDAASTRKALSLLPDLPPHPRILEFGCGSGAATLVLAEAGAHVTALDIHQPFLDQLKTLAAERQVAKQVQTICADMLTVEITNGSYDVVWAEGAIYFLGFEAGLMKWKTYVRPGGYIVVTEPAWLCDDPPKRAIEYWEAEYPAITTSDQHLAMIESAQLEPIAHFPLPRQAWAAYLEPVQDELQRFQAEHPGDQHAEDFVADEQREIDMWRECGDSYGYVFYLARVP